jgi:hypothetical protein
VQRDQLIERRDGFNYDYRMKCHYGRSSFLSARDYADEINQAHMDREHCGANIHFGRAVIAIRDEEDPALDDELVPRLAWYHSSTWPGLAVTAPFIAWRRLFRWVGLLARPPMSRAT